MSLGNTMEQLWQGQNALHGKASRLRQSGNTQAANELDATAYRLGNQLLEVEAVVQEHAAELAATDQPTAPVAEARPAQQEAH